MPPLTYEGMNCVAVLDADAGTLTLAHSGMTTPRHKKESSPWVIPLGAISDVEFKEKSAMARGWVRIVLVNRVGYSKAQLEDVNAFFAGKDKVSPFVEALNSARTHAAPAEMPSAAAPSTTQRMEAYTAGLQAKSDQLKAERGDRNVLRSDIQAAKARMQGTIGVSRELKNLESHMWHGETVAMMCGGQYGRGQGLLVLTNTRLLFVFHGITGQTTEDFPLDKISSIQWSAGMIMGTVTIFASGNKAEIGNVVKADGKQIVDRVRAIISGQANAAPAPIHTPVPATAPPPAPAPAAPPPPPPPPPSVPADWYPDANNPALLRYWDGVHWTEHTAPRPPH